MSNTPENLRLGPCNLYLFEGGADVSLGYVDGVEYSFTGQVQNLMGGQNGSGFVDRVITGLEGKVKFNMQEVTIVNWRRAMAGMVAIFQNAGNTAKRLEWRSMPGKSMRSIGVKLTLKPIYGGIETTDLTEILVVPIAAPDPGTFNLAFGSTTQEVIPATYDMYPDPTKNNLLAYLGDNAGTVNVAGTW